MIKNRLKFIVNTFESQKQFGLIDQKVLHYQFYASKFFHMSCTLKIHFYFFIFQINYIFVFSIGHEMSPFGRKISKKCFLRSDLEIMKIFTISEIECGNICCCQINM